jgi:glycine/D-amino acid oxidase-like deaminating enzyme
VANRRVIVIGAGVLGLACAAELSDADDLDVTVLDRRAPGSGSTGLSAGVYSCQYVNRQDVELRTWGIRRLEQLSSDHGLVLRRIGFLRPSQSRELTATFHTSVGLQEEYGLPGARVIDADEFARLVPHLRYENFDSALYAAREGYLDGNELCGILAEVATARGVAVVGRARLQSVRRGGRAKYTLATTRGEFPADVIINCGGAWAAEIGRVLEAPVEVVNERHENHIFNLPPSVTSKLPFVLDYVPGHTKGQGLFFRHEGAHQMIAGLHSNDVLGEDQVSDPDNFHTGTTQERADDIITRVAQAFPSLHDITYAGGWAGLYPHSPDQRLVAGPHPDNPDVLVGGGLGGAGLTVGQTLGRLLADWVRHGEPRIADASNLAPRPVSMVP